MNSLIVSLLSFEGDEIPVRSDGYWNLTAMCKARGKNFADFLRLKATKEYLQEFNYDVPEENRPSATKLGMSESKLDSFPDMGIPMSNPNTDGCEENPDMQISQVGDFVSLSKPEGIWVEPLEINKGGRPQEQGTWGHPEVALKLAAWINPRLEVWVYRSTMKLLTRGMVEMKEQAASFKTALSQSQSLLAEKDAFLEETSNELALASYRLDQLRYERDELAEIAQFRRENCWEAEVEYLDDNESLDDDGWEDWF